MITCMSTVPVTTTPPDGSGGGGETGKDVGALVLVEPIGESPEPIGITGAAVGQLFALG